MTDAITSLKQQIGTRVRMVRRLARLTQEQLAAEIERSTEAISNIERGESLPPIDTLLRIAEVLEVPLTQFLEPVDGHPSRARAELEAEIRIKLHRLDDEKAALALKLISALAEGTNPARL